MAGMVDTVKIPVFGQVKKSYAIAGGVGIVAIGGYIIIRRRGQSQAATASTSAMVTDPAGNTCTALGTSGYCPGTPQDLEAQQSLEQEGFLGGGGPGDTGTQGITGTTGFTTNGEWVQAVEQQLSEEGTQESADTVTIALGKYVQGSPLTPDQVTIVQQGIGLENYPPVNGPTGYPPSLNTSAATPPPTTVVWKKVTATGSQSLAQMQIAADPNVTFAQVLAKNDWASKYEGKDIPKGYGVYLGYAS